MWSDYYPNVDQSEKAEKAKINRWVDALIEYPADLVQLAYLNWFRNDVKGFAPRGAGQLMASIKPILLKRKTLLAKALEMPHLIARHEAEEFDPATRVSPEDIERINLRPRRMQETIAPDSPLPDQPKPKGKKSRDAQLEEKRRRDLKTLMGDNSGNNAE